jgi:hypothetical protein
MNLYHSLLSRNIVPKKIQNGIFTVITNDSVSNIHSNGNGMIEKATM